MLVMSSPSKTPEQKFPDRETNIDQLYCYLKHKYIEQNPQATPSEYSDAIADICERIGY